MLSKRRERRYATLLELPEIISGMLVLFVVLWEIGFSTASLSNVDRAAFVDAGYATMCILIIVYTAAVCIHWLATVLHKAHPSRFLWMQVIVGLLASLLVCGKYWDFIPPVTPYSTLLLSFIIGVSSIIGLFSCILNRRNRLSNGKSHLWSPAVIFFTSLLAWIVVSSLMLMTPGATKPQAALHFIDAFFMCASATAITGLSTVSIADTFTPVGKAVILADVQVGALGVITFSYFVLMMVGRRLDLRDSRTMSSIFDQEDVRMIPGFIKSIVFITLFIEAIGAVLLYWAWSDIPSIPESKRWGYAVFHSISSFCNAGISLFPANMAQDVVAHHYAGQIVMMLMMMSGTLGFGVYLEGIMRLRKKLRRQKNPRNWSTHSWLVIRVTIFVLIFGSIGLTSISLIEPNAHSISGTYNMWEALWNSIGRSAGFNISNIDQYGPVYHLFLGLLMFMGGNPAGTGGGVFAPVLALCLLEILRVLRGHQDVNLHNRRIARNTIDRAMSTVVLSILWISFTTLLLLLLEPTITNSPQGIIKIFFEEVSAYTTSGYSLGITSQLSNVSKIIITLNMIFGRVGMFTFMMIFIQQKEPPPIRFPETKLPLT